ncbi:MAG: hypothetical protein FP824_01070 [Euryarchaeota archaeon]|nr:hypothetical protein [Euryarchaeota archaeon]
MEVKITKMSSRVVLLCLLTLIILSIALRYPTTPHQLGADGYFNNAMAKFIIDDGYAKWILTPFSYLGLGPFAYPAAMHFFVATIAQLGNIPIEEAVLYLNLMLGVCGVLFSFLMVRELTNNRMIALLASFFFSTSPEFLRLTNWNGSSRSMVMVFFLLLIFLLFRTQYAKRSESHSHYIETIITFLTLILLLIIGTMHRMWIFSIFILIGYAMARPLTSIKKVVNVRTGIWNQKNHRLISFTFFALWGLAIAGLIMAQLSNFAFYGGMNLWSKYQTGLFFSGSSIPALFMNLAIDYWSGWGLISVFLIVGAYLMFRARNKKFSTIFLLGSILSIAPIATLGLYSKLILIVFVTPLVAIGLIWFISQKKLRRIALPLLLVILIASGGFNVLMVDHWQNSSGGDYMKESEYDLALFVKYNLDETDTYISNNQVFGNQVLSVADSQYLTERFLYPVIYGWVTKNEITNLIDLRSMIEEQSIELYYPEEYAITMDHREITLNDVDRSMFIRSIYNVNHAIDSRVTTTNYWIEPSLYETRYIIFSNQDGRVWYLG